MNGAPIQGVGQGNGAGPQIWAAVSSPLFDVIQKITAGVHLTSNISRKDICFAGLGFVNDVNLLSVNNQKDTSLESTLGNLHLLLNEWEAGLWISGEALSASKSRWTAIDFQWVKSRWVYKNIDQLQAQLFMQDVSGKTEQLSCLEPWEAKWALGIWLAADGNMKMELEYHIQQAQEWAHRVSQVRASKMLTWINFHSVLLRKLEYPLTATMFSKEQCEEIMQPALKILLPAIGLNCHFPWLMLFGHQDHYGLAFPHLYDTQGYLHIVALFSFAKGPSITNSLIRHSYEVLQLELGLPNEILLYNYNDWSHLVTPTWLTHTWKYLSDNHLEVYSDIPPLSALCAGDEFIIEQFWKSGFWGKKLVALNWCQMWLQVITTSEITDGVGFSVLPDFLYGKKQKCSSIHSFLWPKVIEPENHLWSVWQQAIWCIFPLQPANHSIPLGNWLVDSMLWPWLWVAADHWLLKQCSS